MASRHPSGNGDSNNRESSLDDSGVVDDHEEGDVTSEDVAQIPNVVQVSSAWSEVCSFVSARVFLVHSRPGVGKDAIENLVLITSAFL